MRSDTWPASWRSPCAECSRGMTPYDEAKHRQELGLVQLDQVPGSTTVDVSPQAIDIDGPDELIIYDSGGT